MTTATIQLDLTGTPRPGIEPPPVETHTVCVPVEGVLKLIPQGDLFTQGCDDEGKTERLPPEQWLRYYFHLAVAGDAVQLTQVPDEYSFMPPYGFRGGPTWQAPWTSFRLQLREPVTIYYNVPGGGPEWTLTLLELKT
jgi:hypothetical protein